METLSPIPQHHIWKRYTIALGSTAVSILLRGALEPVLGHAGFFATLYIAVVYSSLVCGLGPSIVAAVIGTIGIMYWFVDPRHTLSISNRTDVHALIAWVLVCPVLIALGEANRRKRLRINQTNSRLEQLVTERTAELSQSLAVLKSEICVREEAEEQLRRLSLRLMTVQDEERRRIARDLHDSAGQALAAIKMNLITVQRIASGLSSAESVLMDLNTLVDEVLLEIRTTSYLLHPPLLDEAGFASAARWYVEGFTKRSGIKVACDMPGDVERLPEDVELTLFRVLQESLTNIHRHSGATAATVRFVRDATKVELQVSDNGHGLSSDQLQRLRESAKAAGVGIAGMRERLRGVGGQVSVQSNRAGTTVTAMVPQSAIKGRSSVSAA